MVDEADSARSTNLTWHAGRVDRDERWRRLATFGGTVWFTGLSGSGKSTVAAAVEQKLLSEGHPAYRLDGDNLRTGLNADLDFTKQGREENVRRVGEVARLFADAGVVALVALISPFRDARNRVRDDHEHAGLAFVEVYMAAPIEVCAQRDPKGLYARAAVGSVEAFTGVDDPYEVPESPELTLRADVDVDSAVDEVLSCLRTRARCVTERAGSGPG